MRLADRARSLAAISRLVCLIGLIGIAAACRPGETREPHPPDRTGTAFAPGEAPTVRSEPDRPKIVALGDSLTAGLGLDVEEAFPAELQERIDDAGYSYQVLNAGVSGDTTAGGLSRVDWVLEGDVRVLILALGGNDGLRGLPAAEMKRNLAAIMERAQAKGVAVLLAGMEAPPNMGAEYTSEFRQVFRDLAEEYDVVFLPFLLDGVAGEPDLNQRDGIHPNAEGARRLADSIWPLLRPMLESKPAP